MTWKTISERDTNTDTDAIMRLQYLRIINDYLTGSGSRRNQTEVAIPDIRLFPEQTRDRNWRKPLHRRDQERRRRRRCDADDDRHRQKPGRHSNVRRRRERNFRREI